MLILNKNGRAMVISAVYAPNEDADREMEHGIDKAC